MSNVDLNVDRWTDGKADALYRTLLQAGATMMYQNEMVLVFVQNYLNEQG